MLTANHAALANELHMQRLRRNIALLSAKELIHENMFSCEKSQPRANHPTYSNKYMVGRFSYGQETPPGLLPQAHSCMNELVVSLHNATLTTAIQGTLILVYIRRLPQKTMWINFLINHRILTRLDPWSVRGKGITPRFLVRVRWFIRTMIHFVFCCLMHVYENVS